MKFVSLFAGIGGIDLGLERAGHTCVGQVEIDEYATKVLDKHWPDTPRIRDVRDFQGHEFGDFDLLAGGYPCQPFSLAGSRKGEHDERHLWPEVHRIIRNARPKYVFLENVTGHLSLGFGRVLGDLAESGYDAEWDCIPAAAVGAPHRRDRVFIIATRRTEELADADSVAYHTRESRRTNREVLAKNQGLRRGASEGQARKIIGSGSTNVADADNNGRVTTQKRAGAIQRSDTSTARSKSASQFARRGGKSTSMDANTKKMVNTDSTQCKRNRSAVRAPKKHADTSSASWWAIEPDVGRVAHGIPARVDRLRTLGNAVVPQVAQWIGLRLPL